MILPVLYYFTEHTDFVTNRIVYFKVQAEFSIETNTLQAVRYETRNFPPCSSVWGIRPVSKLTIYRPNTVTLLMADDKLGLMQVLVMQLQYWQVLEVNNLSLHPWYILYLHEVNRSSSSCMYFSIFLSVHSSIQD